MTIENGTRFEQPFAPNLLQHSVEGLIIFQV